MIEAYGFGKICINGAWYTQDLRIKGGAILSDWWRRRGHFCEPADIEDLLTGVPEILILGQGTPGMMRATPELKQLLQQQGIELIEQPTAEAVDIFNKLHKEKDIVAGFHLTC